MSIILFFFLPENVDAYMAASGSDNVEEKLKVNVFIFLFPTCVCYIYPSETPRL